MERVAGIEPASSAWKAAALPLCYTRAGRNRLAVSGVSVERALRQICSWAAMTTYARQNWSLATATARPQL